MVSRSLGALALCLLSALAPAFVSEARPGGSCLIAGYLRVTLQGLGWLIAGSFVLFCGRACVIEMMHGRHRWLPDSDRSQRRWLCCSCRARLQTSTMLQAALERAPMRAWPFGPAPTSARPWLWRQLGALRNNLVFLTLALAALTFVLNFGNSPPGIRVRRAAKTMMKPFRPELAKDRMAERDVVGSITERIENWTDHATIIAGRFGSGKTVALEAALRDRRGVYVHTVLDKDWVYSLYKDLGLDNLGMLKDALRLVKKRNRGSTPILVLEIPRTTKEGATSATLVVLCLIRLGAGVDTVSTFAKILSSDSSLAHAGTRRLSRPASLCCGRVLWKLSAGFLPR